MPSSPRIAFPSRIGVFWHSGARSTPSSMEVARNIEALGFGSLFFPEGDGKESFVQAAAYLSATTDLVVGTGIANIYLRHPTGAEGATRALGALHPGRFVLGLGVSHRPVLAGFGVSQGSPMADLRSYLGDMDAVSDAIESGAERPARILAALGPKMVELAGTATDGAFPLNITPQAIPAIRDGLGPDKWMITGLPVALGGDADDQVRRSAAYVARYATLPNYRRAWIRQGFTEAEAAGSPRLVSGITSSGIPAAIARIEEHFDGGADHVLIALITDRPEHDPLPDLRELARALDL